jgi:hypothetical protein
MESSHVLKLLQLSLARPQATRDLMMMGVGSNDSSRPQDSGDLIVVGVGPHDVLLGRSPKVYSAPGNQLFRKIINEHLAHYQKKSTRSHKQCLALHIVDKIQEAGGRFKRFRSSDGVWAEVSIEIAKEKVCHALRDARLNANRNGISGPSDSKKKGKSNRTRNVNCLFHVNRDQRLINRSWNKGELRPDPSELSLFPKSSLNVSCTPEEVLDCQIATLLRLRSVILARAQQHTLLSSINLSNQASTSSQVLLHPFQSELDQPVPVQTVAPMIQPVMMNQPHNEYVHQSCSADIESQLPLKKDELSPNGSQSMSNLNDMNLLPVSPDNFRQRHHLAGDQVKSLTTRKPRMVHRSEDEGRKLTSIQIIHSTKRPCAIQRKSCPRQVAPWHALVPKGPSSRHKDSIPSDSVPTQKQESRQDGLDLFENEDFPRCDDKGDMSFTEEFPTEHTFNMLKLALDMCHDYDS